MRATLARLFCIRLVRGYGRGDAVEGRPTTGRHFRDICADFRVHLNCQGCGLMRALSKNASTAISVTAFAGMLFGLAKLGEWQHASITQPLGYIDTDRWGNEHDTTLTVYGLWAFLISVMLAVKIYRRLMHEHVSREAALGWNVWAACITVIAITICALSALPEPIPAAGLMDLGVMAGVGRIGYLTFQAIMKD